MASKAHTIITTSKPFSGEPTLDELFAEPIVQLFMERDHIDAGQLRGTLHAAQQSPLSMAASV